MADLTTTMEVSDSVATKSLPLEQLKILRAFTEGDLEYCYGYKYFESETGLDRKTLKKHMTELRTAGIVYYARGLMNEDGEVAGSGFGVRHQVTSEMYDLIENMPDALEYQLAKDIDDTLIYPGGMYGDKRTQTTKSLLNLIEEYIKKKGTDLLSEDSTAPQSDLKAQ